MRPCEIVKLVEYIKEQTGHTGDIFININDNAIPIEWIKEHYAYYGIIKTLIEEWEKENEID